MAKPKNIDCMLAIVNNVIKPTNSFYAETPGLPNTALMCIFDQLLRSRGGANTIVVLLAEDDLEETKITARLKLLEWLPEGVNIKYLRLLDKDYENWINIAMCEIEKNITSDIKRCMYYSINCETGHEKQGRLAFSEDYDEEKKRKSLEFFKNTRLVRDFQKQ